MKDTMKLEELRPHQVEALKQMKDGSILWGGVGSGKSRVAVSFYELHHDHQDVYVITTAKKRDSKDWEGEFARIGVGKAPNASVRGVLTVDSWNNLDKYKGVTGAFFIFDEQRLVGSGAWVKAFLKIAKQNEWILLSATPGDTWLDYIPVFVANGFYKNRTQFKQEHVIYKPFSKFPKVDRYVGVGRLQRYRNQILVHMRYENQTVRHEKLVIVEHNERMLKEVLRNRWHLFQDRPIKDISELFGVLRRVVNEDPSRIRAIKDLLEQHPKIVVFYNFNYELDALKRMGDDLRYTMGIEYSEWNGWRHEEIPESASWLYFVQYVAGAEGWNCVETDTIVFYSLTYSYKLWEQSRGRIDRMNTPYSDLFYYTFRSKAGIDTAIWRALKAKKNFYPKEAAIENLKE
jgi:hypothetical protein